MEQSKLEESRDAEPVAVTAVQCLWVSSLLGEGAPPNTPAGGL